MAYDHKSFMKGLAAGLVSKGRLPKGEQKEPVAYLYNGVRLPKLPVVDGFTYAYIARRTSTDSYILYSSSVQGVMKTTLGLYQSIAVYFGNDCAYEYTVENNAWVTDDVTPKADQIVIYTSLGGLGNCAEVLWSNVDILNDDGSVYHEASDPVPVYE